MIGMLAFQSIFDRFYMANGVLNSYRNLKNNMEAFQHERKSNSRVLRWS